MLNLASDPKEHFNRDVHVIYTKQIMSTGLLTLLLLRTLTTVYFDNSTTNQTINVQHSS